MTIASVLGILFVEEGCHAYIVNIQLFYHLLSFHVSVAIFPIAIVRSILV